jgi:predicted RNA binding protein YcfA (HicA-like mRNA interferase family)
LGKLKTLSGKEVCTILESYGFSNVRQKGNHLVMQKLIPQGTITVPVPNHKEIKKGTLQSLIRQSQLEKSIFETK